MTGEHKHTCTHNCGAYYLCSRRDGCDWDDWTCPQCQDDEQAAHMTAQELATTEHATDNNR